MQWLRALCGAAPSPSSPCVLLRAKEYSKVPYIVHRTSYIAHRTSYGLHRTAYIVHHTLPCTSHAKVDAAFAQRLLATSAGGKKLLDAACKGRLIGRALAQPSQP